MKIGGKKKEYKRKYVGKFAGYSMRRGDYIIESDASGKITRRKIKDSDLFKFEKTGK
jgi:hypothetical protein